MIEENKRRWEPIVSLVLPIRNEESFIRQTLDSIIGQDYPRDQMEILIADGDSDDHTLAVLEEYRKDDSRIRVFSNPQRIVATGLNRLLREAKGEVVIRIDGHCIIDPDYVSNCVSHLSREGIVAVGGAMKTIESSFSGRAISIAQSSRFGVGNSSFRTESGQTKFVDTIPFPAYTMALIREVGLYDEELVRNQDDEYNYRIRKAGYPILLADDVRSTYYARSSFKKLWRQYYQYGFFKVRVLQKHPKQMSLRQFVPLLLVLALILFLCLSLLSSWGWIALVSLLAAYLLAVVTVSILQSLKFGGENFFKLLLAYPVLHFSYGLGFLAGLFRFWNRWGDKVGGVPDF